MTVHELEKTLNNFRKYHLSMAYSRLRNRQDAEDCVQDAYIRIINGINKYDDKRDFYNWSSVVVCNVALDKIRHRKVAAKHYNILINEYLATPTDDPLKIVFKAIVSNDIKEALNKLDHNHRTALLSTLSGMEYKEVAEITGIPIGTIRSRIHRAKKTMRLYLEGKNSEVP
jgi:RNA polymerase sigma-70 factor, ECF subfamily